MPIKDNSHQNAKRAARVIGSGAENESGKAISETAAITLRAYAMCGIPLAQEFLSCIKQMGLNRKGWLRIDRTKDITPDEAVILRARYLGANAVIRNLIRSGSIGMVVERAAGMYPLGFNITNDYPVTYIETDISADFGFKPDICAKVSRDLGVTAKGRLLFTNMDAVTLDGVSLVSDMLKGREKPIGYVDAGLQIYLRQERFDCYLDASKRLLGIRDGSFWIASDLSFRTVEFVESMIRHVPKSAVYFARIKEKLGVDYKTFPQNRKSLLDLLDGNGFMVRGYAPMQIGYKLGFDGLEKSELAPQQVRDYLQYLNENFRTLVIQLRK